LHLISRCAAPFFHMQIIDYKDYRCAAPLKFLLDQPHLPNAEFFKWQSRAIFVETSITPWNHKRCSAPKYWLWSTT